MNKSMNASPFSQAALPFYIIKLLVSLKTKLNKILFHRLQINEKNRIYQILTFLIVKLMIIVQDVRHLKVKNTCYDYQKDHGMLQLPLQIKVI